MHRCFTQYPSNFLHVSPIQLANYGQEFEAADAIAMRYVSPPLTSERRMTGDLVDPHVRPSAYPAHHTHHNTNMYSHKSGTFERPLEICVCYYAGPKKVNMIEFGQNTYLCTMSGQKI